MANPVARGVAQKRVRGHIAPSPIRPRAKALERWGRTTHATTICLRARAPPRALSLDRASGAATSACKPFWGKCADRERGTSGRGGERGGPRPPGCTLGPVSRRFGHQAMHAPSHDAQRKHNWLDQNPCGPEIAKAGNSPNAMECRRQATCARHTSDTELPACAHAKSTTATCWVRCACGTYLRLPYGFECDLRPGGFGCGCTRQDCNKWWRLVGCVPAALCGSSLHMARPPHGITLSQGDVFPTTASTRTAMLATDGRNVRRTNRLARTSTSVVGERRHTGPGVMRASLKAPSLRPRAS